MKKAEREVRLEQLIGKRVLARNGHSIGRLEEVVAEKRGRSLVVSEYHVGRFAVLDRLAAWSIARPVLALFKARREYRIPWNKLDISDPAQPRLTCTVEEIEQPPETQ